MAYQFTYTLPGDVGEEGTAANRLKEAIDWLHRHEPIPGDNEVSEKPQSPADYKQFVDNMVIGTIKSFILQQEESKRRAQLGELSDIDIQA